MIMTPHTIVKDITGESFVHSEKLYVIVPAYVQDM
jgi:hypothetical protein